MKRLQRRWLKRKRHVQGQSLVEMSFVLPLLLIVLFGVIDIAYYVYCYATVYKAARQGSDLAAFFPPFPTRLDGSQVVNEEKGLDYYDPDAYDMSDKCVNAIVTGIRKGALLVDLDDIAYNRDHFSITYYPAPDLPADLENDPRQLGKTIQVAITHTIEPLTPLFGLIPVFGNHGRMTVYAKSMRTIQGIGESLPMNETGYEDQRVICRE